MSIFKLIREFSKRYGRSPSPSELDKLKKQSDIIQQQDTVIPFPQGGKDRLSPFDDFKASEDAYEQSQKLTPIEAMKEANSLIGRKGRYKNISPEDAKKKLGELEGIIKSEKLEPEDLVGDDLGDMLKNYDGDPDAMAGGGLAGALAKLKKKYGKNIIQKGKAPKKNEKKKLQDMFKDFNKRTNKADGGVTGTELAIKESLEAFKRYQKAGGKLSYKDFIASGNEGVGRFFKSGGLAYMLGESRDGLKEGGPPNPGRRNFLKLMAGLASIPVVGKFFKPAAKVAKVVPLQNTSTVMPAWFPKLIDKAMDRGIKNKVDADLMEIEVPELPGVKIQRHDDGRVFVEGSNEYGRPYAIEYEPPGFEVVNEKTGKAVKTKGDFRAIDSVPEASGPDDVPDFFGQELDEVDDILGSDVRVMEEFATGSKIKNPKRGENVVGQAEVRAENAADEAAERAAMEAEDFATGGLAKLLGE